MFERPLLSPGLLPSPPPSLINSLQAIYLIVHLDTFQPSPSKGTSKSSACPIQLGVQVFLAPPNQSTPPLQLKWQVPYTTTTVVRLWAIPHWVYLSHLTSFPAPSPSPIPQHSPSPFFTYSSMSSSPCSLKVILSPLPHPWTRWTSLPFSTPAFLYPLNCQWWLAVLGQGNTHESQKQGFRSYSWMQCSYYNPSKSCFNFANRSNLPLAYFTFDQFDKDCLTSLEYGGCLHWLCKGHWVTYIVQCQILGKPFIVFRLLNNAKIHTLQICIQDRGGCMGHWVQGEFYKGK